MYKPLEEPCKNCLGCMRLEDPNFTGDKNCKWQEKKKTAQDYIEQIKLNLGVKNEQSNK